MGWSTEIKGSGGGGGGEINTASNVGTGAGVFKEKVLSDLVFKSLLESKSVIVEADTNDIIFKAGFLNKIVITDAHALSIDEFVNSLILVDTTTGEFDVTLPELEEEDELQRAIFFRIGPNKFTLKVTGAPYKLRVSGEDGEVVETDFTSDNDSLHIIYDDSSNTFLCY